MIPEEYLVVEARIAKELDNIRQLEEELSGYKLFPRIATSSVGGFALTDSAVCRITGSILHDYYVAVENIFKVVAGRIDRTVPSGEYWHKEILEQMTLEVPGVRPPVVAPETARKLDELRAFRHVFRNVYGFNLSPEKIRELLVQLPEVSSLFKRDLGRFKERMRKALYLS
ncbi:MAG: ribonuclease toxin HepT-like protein [Desulfotomaculales bacterium]